MIRKTELDIGDWKCNYACLFSLGGLCGSDYYCWVKENIPIYQGVSVDIVRGIRIETGTISVSFEEIIPVLEKAQEVLEILRMENIDE